MDDLFSLSFRLLNYVSICCGLIFVQFFSSVFGSFVIEKFHVETLKKSSAYRICVDLRDSIRVLASEPIRSERNPTLGVATTKGQSSCDPFFVLLLKPFQYGFDEPQRMRLGINEFCLDDLVDRNRTPTYLNLSGLQQK